MNLFSLDIEEESGILTNIYTYYVEEFYNYYRNFHVTQLKLY